MKRVGVFVAVVLIVIMLVGCGGSGGNSVKDNVSDVAGIPLTQQLKKAVEENHLGIKSYGFSWEYAGMPSVFVEITPTTDIGALADKYGINADGSRLYDVWDGDGRSYIDMLPCKGSVCTLKSLKDKIVDKVSYVRFNVTLNTRGGFTLMFFLPKAGMTWQNTASLTREDMLTYIAQALGVSCTRVKDNMGLLECKTDSVFISVGNELGSVVYGGQ